MFRMFRPSLRPFVHERISQNEDAADAGGNGITNINQTINGGLIATIGGSNGGSNNNNNNGASVGIISSVGDQRLSPTAAAGIDAVGGGGGGSGDEDGGGIAALGDGDDHSSSPVGGGVNDGNAIALSSSLSSNSLVILDGNVGSRNSRPSSNSDDDDDELEGVLQQNPTTHPFLSAQIERERFIRYRRQSTCTLLILFFLIRLWIEALLTKDIGLIFLSMMGTLWTYRWVANRSVDEEEYERQIIMDIERQGQGGDGGGLRRVGDAEEGNAAGGADAAVNFDPDLGLMSFQAQLALAILESQRQMFENGGYGGNNRNNDGPGVTNEAREKWKTFEWGVSGVDDVVPLTRTSSLQSIKRLGSGSNYGSLSTIDDGHLATASSAENSSNNERCLDAYDDIGLVKGGEEEPSCSICLCEYERGERVVRLPCDHIYHDSCLTSWTTNHTRCPLCNYDLMDGFQQPASVQQQQAQQHAEEQRAFRTMALSALGRRIRPRSRTSTAGRRGGVATSGAADDAAALEGSIV
jgi:hypothetical protein